MDTRKAKKVAAANGAELVYNKDAKSWNLSIVGTSVADALDSKILKGYDEEELIDEIEGLKTQVEAPKTRGRKRRYPQGIAWSKGTKGSAHGGRKPQQVQITLPDGSDCVGSFEPVRGKYFFFPDEETGKTYGGRAEDFMKRNEDGSFILEVDLRG